MRGIQIDRRDDPRLAEFRNVPDADLVTRHGLFVAEGRLVVRRLLSASSLVARSVMVTEVALSSLQDLLATRDGPPVYVVPQTVMDDITGFHIHRGCLALGERPGARSVAELTRDAHSLVAIEGVSDADNVGSIFRNAAAFGVHAVIVGPSCADPLYRKAIRTSMGAALTMPFAEARAWPDTLQELRANGWAVVAMTPSRAARPVAEVAQMISGHRVAVVVGHEGDGLTEGALASSTHHARIAIANEVDSVNVATAVAIALYELTRPR